MDRCGQITADDPQVRQAPRANHRLTRATHEAGRAGCASAGWQWARLGLPLTSNNPVLPATSQRSFEWRGIGLRRCGDGALAQARRPPPFLFGEKEGEQRNALTNSFYATLLDWYLHHAVLTRPPGGLRQGATFYPGARLHGPLGNRVCSSDGRPWRPGPATLTLGRTDGRVCLC